MIKEIRKSSNKCPFAKYSNCILENIEENETTQQRPIHTHI